MAEFLVMMLHPLVVTMSLVLVHLLPVLPDLFTIIPDLLMIIHYCLMVTHHFVTGIADIHFVIRNGILGLTNPGKQEAGCDEYGKFRVHDLFFLIVRNLHS